MKSEKPPYGRYSKWCDSYGVGVKYAGEAHPMQETNLRAFNVMMQWPGGLNYCVWPKKYAERYMIMVPLPPWDKRLTI
jgi:hypothetical protein